MISPVTNKSYIITYNNNTSERQATYIRKRLHELVLYYLLLPRKRERREVKEKQKREARGKSKQQKSHFTFHFHQDATPATQPVQGEQVS